MKQICNDKNNSPYACGQEAKSIFRRFINHPAYYKKIYCYYSERDKYKRILGECCLGAETKVNIN